MSGVVDSVGQVIERGRAYASAKIESCNFGGTHLRTHTDDSLRQNMKVADCDFTKKLLKRLAEEIRFCLALSRSSVRDREVGGSNPLAPTFKSR